MKMLAPDEEFDAIVVTLRNGLISRGAVPGAVRGHLPASERWWFPDVESDEDGIRRAAKTSRLARARSYGERLRGLVTLRWRAASACPAPWWCASRAYPPTPLYPARITLPPPHGREPVVVQRRT